MTARIRPIGALWLCTLVLMLAACGDESPTGGEAGTGLRPNTIGPNGGTLDFAGGNVTLVFPPGAVSQDVTVTVQATSTFPRAPTVVLGTAYDFGPEATQFAEPVQLTINYNPASLPSGVQASELRLYTVVGTGWQEVPGSTVDLSSNTVTGSISGFSVYGILGLPAASVTLLPNSASIVEGGTVRLVATVRDSEGNELTGREVIWSSSDEAVATVDATGLVRGVAEGTATITATSEGQNGSATITVIVPGDLDVTASTTGQEFDSDGYIVTVDDTQSQPIGVNAAVTFTDLEPGDHSVALSEVAINCTVAGQNPRMVKITKSTTTQTRFDILCVSASISIQTPLQNERFVVGEAVSFAAVVETNPPVDPSNIEWSSSLDGHLGNGLTLETTGLSLGTHTITASVFGSQEEISVRVFTDLWTLYQAAPAQGEIERILGDFNFMYVDGQGVDESWAPYDNFHFDQESQDPSKIVAVARLDILRHQRFSEPLPITPSNTTGYDYVRSHVQTIRLRLDCGFSTGGGGAVSLNRGFSVWDGRPSGTAADPDACKSPFDRSLFPYVSPLQLLVHEARHSDPADPRHTVCDNGIAGDAELENGSGFAWGALYAMWVYGYGLYDPAFIKNFAKDLAIILLGRICTPPTHSNPLVQALLDELLGP